MTSIQETIRKTILSRPNDLRFLFRPREDETIDYVATTSSSSPTTTLTSSSSSATASSQILNFKPRRIIRKYLFPGDKSYFHILSDDIIFGILFSGYLGYTYHELMDYLSISKNCYQIGMKTIGLLELLDNYSPSIIDSLTKSTIRSDSILSQGLQSVVYLKINYGDCDRMLSQKSELEAIQKWKHSLKALSLRGTWIDDERVIYLLVKPLPGNNDTGSGSMLELPPSSPKLTDSPSSIEDEDEIQYEPHFCQLQCLDLSKDILKRKSYRISNYALVTIIPAYRQLTWLSLAQTVVQDESIVVISKHLSQSLRYLNLQSCRMLTNKVGIPLSQLSKLNCLDISSCINLNTNLLFPLLFADHTDKSNTYANKPNQMKQSLQIFSCAYIKNFTVESLKEIIKNCPNLQRLDCRSKTYVQELPKDYVSRLREKLQILLVDQKDQLAPEMRGRVTIMDTDPDYASLWMFTGWPYHNQD